MSGALDQASVPIVALASAWGPAAIAVVRVSGTELVALVRAICGRVPPPRAVRRVELRDADGVFDDGLLTWMPAPHSYTGEDVAEVSCHGNPLIVERLLRAFQAQGARLAGPGEFTRRALLNGKMDLCRAEAVLQAITATSPAGLRVARRGLSGDVSAALASLASTLTDVAAELEAILDYPGEDHLFRSDQELIAILSQEAERIQGWLARYPMGRLAVQGAKVALLGPVNAGKSSLFNALLGQTRALVSPTPGTTRDVVESVLRFDALQVTLLDTAGERTTDDPIEAAGLELGRAMSAEADLVVVVLPLHRSEPMVGALLDRTAQQPRLIVGTHADQPDWIGRPPVPFLPVSSTTGAGLAELRAAIPAALLGEEPGEAAVLIGSERQRDLLLTVQRQLRAACTALTEAGPAAAAEHLYGGLEEINVLIGRDTRESVMDRLFEKFCVGK